MSESEICCICGDDYSGLDCLLAGACPDCHDNADCLEDLVDKALATPNTHQQEGS